MDCGKDESYMDPTFYNQYMMATLDMSDEYVPLKLLEPLYMWLTSLDLSRLAFSDVVSTMITIIIIGGAIRPITIQKFGFQILTMSPN